MQPVALVPKGIDIPAAEMALVASAIQLQLVRDVYPAWGVQASCTAYPSYGDVPPGYSIAFVVPDAKGKAGMHFRPEHPDAPPMAIVQFRERAGWSYTASHEVLEMLVDPAGARMARGPHPYQPGKQVQYLVEICDPCQGMACAYQVDSNHPVLVSDFCVPSFYGTGGMTPPYTHRRSILRPFTVAYGGFLSWMDESGRWFQTNAQHGSTKYLAIAEGDLLGSQSTGNLRGTLDRRKKGYRGPGGPSRMIASAAARLKAIRSASSKAQENRNRLVASFLKEMGL